MPLQITNRESYLSIELIGEIPPNTVDRLIFEFENELKTDMKVIFNVDTRCDNFEMALEIVDLIQDNNIDCIFRGHGEICIFGLVLAWGCKTRTISRSARVNYYEMRAEVQGVFTVPELIQEVDRVQMNMNRVKQLIPLLNEPWLGTAKQAVEFGLFQEISDKIIIRESANIYG